MASPITRAETLCASSLVSAVVCSKNSSVSLRQCLESLVGCDVGEIIVVDGNSLDDSVSIAESFGVIVLHDRGTGIAAARNLGILAATKPFILNFGSDNTIDRQNLLKLVSDLQEKQLTGVMPVTRINGDRFIGRGLDFWRQARFTPGTVSVVGTPSLFVGGVLRKHLFDESRNYSDDGELCNRLSALGHGFGISSAWCFELGKDSLAEVWLRWKLYGSSDAEHFSAIVDRGGSSAEMWESFSHAWRKDLFLPLAQSLRSGLFFLPLLLIMISARYLGFFSHLLNARSKRRKPARE